MIRFLLLPSGTIMYIVDYHSEFPIVKKVSQ